MLPTFPECWLESVAGHRLRVAGNCAIGRASTNDLVVPSQKASRRHATIHAQDGGSYWLIDLGSVNGTILNARRVFQPVQLADGDTIEIGGERYRFHQEAGDTAAEELYGGQSMVTMREIKSERCWLVVADIREFTQLSQELDATALAMTIGGWVLASRECIEKHGGVVNKYLGDGYLAFWRDGDGVAELIAAVLRENQVLQRRERPKFRLVVHAGEVVFGGAANVGEECLMGPEVNFVFRMEKVAGSVGADIMLSAAAHARLAALLPCEPVSGEHELKGFPGKYRFFGSSGGLGESAD